MILPMLAVCRLSPAPLYWFPDFILGFRISFFIKCGILSHKNAFASILEWVRIHISICYPALTAVLWLINMLCSISISPVHTYFHSAIRLVGSNFNKDTPFFLVCYPTYSWILYHNVWLWICRLYFTHVKLGNPAKEFFVQIDTGSDILWVTCSPCTGCPTSSGLNVRPTSYPWILTNACIFNQCYMLA